MAKRSLHEVEDAILAALSPLKAALGVRLVAPYGGELEPDQIAQAMATFPALLVIYAGSTTESHGSRSEASMTWTIVIGDKYQGDLVKARRGDATTPGVYRLLDAVRQALEGKQLLPELLPAESLGDWSLLQAGGVAVHADQYRIPQPYFK
ncbi:hypothetical protein JCM15519_38750 [Fundidesulfovibrio butyratiphilus]